MTTVVWDGRHLVADSRVTFCGQVGARPEPKLAAMQVGETQFYIGFAGRSDMLRPLLMWIRDGADPKRVPSPANKEDGSNGWEAIVVRKEKGCPAQAFLGLGDPLEPLRGRFTLGSGREFALGALTALSKSIDGPATLQQCCAAVVAACEHDTKSGLPFGTIDTAEDEISGVVVEIVAQQLEDSFYHFIPEVYK